MAVHSEQPRSDVVVITTVPDPLLAGAEKISTVQEAADMIAKQIGSK